MKAVIGLAGIAGAAACLAATTAAAQAFPAKPLRIVVPFAAGSATDTVGRTDNGRELLTGQLTAIVHAWRPWCRDHACT